MNTSVDTTRIYPNVVIEDGAEIGDFCIIGLPPKGKASGELATHIGKNAVIRSHTVIYAGNEIGDNFNTGHGALIREENRIGNNVSIGSHTVIEHHLDIHDGVRIHSQAFVPEYTVLEKGCWIGPNVVFTNALHPLCKHVKQCLKGARVKSGAKIERIRPFCRMSQSAKMRLLAQAAWWSKTWSPGLLPRVHLRSSSRTYQSLPVLMTCASIHTTHRFARNPLKNLDSLARRVRIVK